MASNRQSRRTVLKKGAVLTGVGVVGIAGTAGTAVASNPEHCPRTPGYWANHFPEGWPVDDEGDLLPIWLCSDRYTEGGTPSLEDLRDMLLEPPRGDKTVIMRKHLIAAKLNLLVSGSYMFEDPSCREDAKETAAEAEEWLCDHSGNPRRWNGGESLKDTLEAFNEGRLCDCTLEGDE